jgi:hypothetical protein
MSLSSPCVSRRIADTNKRLKAASCGKESIRLQVARSGPLPMTALETLVPLANKMKERQGSPIKMKNNSICLYLTVLHGHRSSYRYKYK